MEQKFQNDQALTTAFFSQAIEHGRKAEIDKWGDSVNLFSARYGSYQAKAADVFLRKYPQSEIVYFAMLDNRDNMGAANRFRKFYQTLTPEQQTSYYGKILDKRLARWEKRNKSSQRFVGTSITYLAGKTPAGQKVDAGKIFKQNKLTLVEFWASWCDSCRMRTPNYQQLYQSYHPKGFDIIAVSLDDDRNDGVRLLLRINCRGTTFRNCKAIKAILCVSG
jgi:thiol-disulfide isomerase/thioredoxin